MAVVETQVIIDVCKRIKDASEAILAALDALEQAKEKCSGSDIVLSTQDDVIAANGDIQHAPAIAYHSMIENIAPAVLVYLTETSVNGKTYYGWLQKIRKAIA